MTAEILHMSSCARWETRYRGPLHLLIAYERLTRSAGEARVDEVAASRRQNLTGTLTFVPAGRSFREWHEPDIPSDALYVHIDPRCAALGEAACGSATLAPRLHFQDDLLWQTILKIKRWTEAGSCARSSYAQALGVMLAHELVQSQVATGAAAEGFGGGLKVWQRRLVADYVEDHLAEDIPMARLAALARLSRYHFCRSFTRSFGTPPHRYHSIRKVERAKEMLANPQISVTEVAFDMGYREASSFTAAFRKFAGQTPTGYRRSLASTGERPWTRT